MAALLPKTEELAKNRGWSQYVLYNLMIEYLEAAGFIEEFHEFALESAKLEDAEGL
jgi:hypothetical protein